MEFRSMPRRGVAGMWLLGILAAPVYAQDPTVQRIASMVAIAVVEYGNGVDARGHTFAPNEYKEAIDFLTEARADAARLPSRSQPAVAWLDSIIQAARRERPPSELAALEKEFAQRLGSDAVIDVPKTRLDPDSGRAIFEANCVSCHGPTGRGDGPLSRTLNPKPPALADPGVMRAVTPEMMFRKIAAGAAGVGPGASRTAARLGGGTRSPSPRPWGVPPGSRGKRAASFPGFARA